MKKRISIFLTAILLCLACAFPVWAGTENRLADQAGLLSADEQDTLSASLDDISERGEVDVVIVTTDSLGEKQLRNMRTIILLTMVMARGRIVTEFCFW